MNQEAKIIWRNFFWLPILKDITGEGLQKTRKKVKWFESVEDEIGYFGNF